MVACGSPVTLRPVLPGQVRRLLPPSEGTPGWCVARSAPAPPGHSRLRASGFGQAKLKLISDFGVHALADDSYRADRLPVYGIAA